MILPSLQTDSPLPITETFQNLKITTPQNSPQAQEAASAGNPSAQDPPFALSDLPIQNKQAKQLVLYASNSLEFAPEPFTGISKVTPIFCQKNDKLGLVPKPALFKVREGMKSSTLLLSMITKDGFYKEKLRLPEHRKAILYHWSLNYLMDEAQLLYMLTSYLDTVRECSNFNLETAVGPSISLDTTEAFAFFVRFKKILEMLFSGKKNARGLTPTFPFAKKLLEDTKYVERADHSVQVQRLEGRLIAAHITIGQNLLDVETACKGNEELLVVMKKVTPLLGFLACVCKDHFGEIELSPGKVISSQGQQRTWQKQLIEVLGQCPRSYFKEQMALYDEALRSLEEILQKNPEFQQPPFNFRMSVDKVTPLQRCADFQADMKVLQELILGPEPEAQEQRRDLSQKELDALFQDEEPLRKNNKQKGASFAKNNHPKPQTQTAASPNLPKVTTLAPPPKTPTAVSRIIQALLKAPGLLYHKRLHRWLKLDLDKIETIRNFVDFRQNHPVLRYANLTEEELKEQFLLHGFSPLVDKILGSTELLKKYALKTELGYSLIVEVIRNGKPKMRGIAAYALSDRCFHRKIEGRSDDEFLKLPLTELAKARVVEPLSKDPEADLQLELLSGFDGDTFEIDPQTERLLFIDRKNSCFIHVFPLS